MSFSNDTVLTSALPDIQQLDTTALSTKYRPVQMLSISIFFIIPSVIMSIVRFQPFFVLSDSLLNIYPIILSAILSICLIALSYQFFAIPRKRYALREHDVSYVSGLLFHQTISQPILRIQHIELKRGPLDRLAGLASLQVFSAGGAAHTFEIPGLDVKVAQQLRHFILQHKDINKHG